MELMKKKAQIRLAEQGRDLLREKMDALIREFFKILSTVSDSRDELRLISGSSDLALLIAQATDDPVALKSAGLPPAARSPLISPGRTSWVSRSRYREETGVQDHARAGLWDHWTSARIDETAERFEAELDLVIRLAETETAMRRLGAEIQMNRRRVNALEQILIPELKSQAKYHEECHRGAGAGGFVPAQEGQEYPGA